MNKTLPKISIIIANFNNDKFLKTCLHSIKLNTKLPHEVIIEDGTELGPCFARNKAANKACGKYLLFLDYDTKVMTKDFLTETIKYMEQHKNIGGGQLKLIRLGTDNFDSAGDKLTPFGFLAERAQEASDTGQFDKAVDIFSGKGAAMLVRRNLFNKLGGFDTSYFMYWEEPDLSWRIWKSGSRYTYLPFDTVLHAYRTQAKPVSRQWDIKITFLGCRNQLATIIKNGNGSTGIIMFISANLAWIVLFLTFLVKLDIPKAKAIIQAYLSLIMRLPKLLTKRSYSDNSWIKHIRDNRPLKWYFGKGIAYILNKPY